MAACLVWLQFHSKVVYLVKSYGIEFHRKDVFVRLIFPFLIASCITFSFVLSLFLAKRTMVWCPFLAASMLGALQLLLGAHSPSHPYTGGIWCLALWEEDWGVCARVGKPPFHQRLCKTGWAATC